jgi:hypothetical protein
MSINDDIDIKSQTIRLQQIINKLENTYIKYKVDGVDVERKINEFDTDEDMDLLIKIQKGECKLTYEEICKLKEIRLRHEIKCQKDRWRTKYSIKLIDSVLSEYS